MSYIGLKTSEHSGTQFKHKKVFTRTHKFLNNQNNYEDVKIEITKNKDDYPNFYLFRRILVLILFIIITIMILPFIYRIDNMMISNKQVNVIQYNRYLDKTETTEEIFKRNLFNKAKEEYKRGKYINAHEKLYAILLDGQNNIPAEILLIKVLEARCLSSNIYCKQLAKYSKHLEDKYAAQNINSTYY